MTKRLKLSLLGTLACAMLVCLTVGGVRLSARAEGTVTVDYSFDVTITSRNSGSVVQSLSAITDPYTNKDVSSGGHIQENVWTDKSVSATQPVVYTARWHHSTSLRTGGFTEYQATAEGNETYKISKITDSDTPAGQMEIPAGGFVVSVPSSVNFGAVGDSVTITATPKTSELKEFHIPTMAIENQDGKRVAIDNINVTRSGPMVVYYDYQRGDKTGTNTSGTEMAAKYDEAKNAFIVTAFRDLYEGDDSGMEIPENGFVLSAYGEGFRGILQQDARFSVGDELSLVGFDYIRFGGVTAPYPYDFINPTLEENPAGYDSATSAPFPAYRGTNQLIVYEWGWNYNDIPGTGTNIYGFEVAVNEYGVVVERGVNVSAIPENGYVLSGHGKGRDFLQANVPMGATVELNKQTKTFTATTSLNSFYTNVATELKTAADEAQRRITQLYDLNRTVLDPLLQQATTACDTLEALKDEIIEKDPQGAEKTKQLMKFNTLQLQVAALTRNIIAASGESKPVAARAVWHRPTERTLSAIKASIQTYKDCGVNLVFAESFYGGMSLFKSDLVPYHVDFEGCNYEEYPDYLTAFVAEAEKEGIEVHAWVEDFYVGLSETQGIVKNHKNWILYNDDDTVLQRNEGGPYIFIDPANADVQNLLINFYKELITKVPNIKGLNLDYIRYPVSSREEDVGFTLAAMNEFAEQQGITLSGTTREELSKSLQSKMKPYANGGNALYKAWNEYRQNKVTSFVERVYKEVKGDSELLISTAVFPSIEESLDQKKQDWRTWLKNAWVDIATPMAYYDNDTDILQYVRDMITATGGASYNYAGLASSFRGLPAYKNASQIQASYLAGANGYVIFCSTQILGHEDVQTVLKSGVNNMDAVLPHASAKAVLTAYFDRICDRADRIYIPAGGMTEGKLASLRAEFDSILALDLSTAKGIGEAISRIEDLDSSASSYASGYSRARLSEAFREIGSLLELKYERRLIMGDEPAAPAEEGPAETPQEEPDKKKGCGSVLAAGTLVVAMATLACAVVVCGKRSRSK